MIELAQTPPVAPASVPPMTLPDAPAWALFLDLDGTLCRYALDPAQVALEPRQCDVLRALAQRLGGALCVLSGRAPDDLHRALGDAAVLARGGHGLGSDAALTAADRAALDAAAAELARLVASHPGTALERKPAGCALHYRAAPEFAESLIRQVRRAARSWPTLRLMEGHCVLELVPVQASKGRAVRELMSTEPFAGRQPVVAGDDVTDEDAFVAAAALGGFGVAVGPRVSPAARHRLADSDALNAWLERLAYTPAAAHG